MLLLLILLSLFKYLTLSFNVFLLCKFYFVGNFFLHTTISVANVFFLESTRKYFTLQQSCNLIWRQIVEQTRWLSILRVFLFFNFNEEIFFQTIAFVANSTGFHYVIELFILTNALQKKCTSMNWDERKKNVCRELCGRHWNNKLIWLNSSNLATKWFD